MIVFNEQRLNELLGQISSGFRSNLLQAVLFFSAVVALAVLFVTIHLVQKRREQRKLDDARQRRLALLASRYSLTAAEGRLIDRLTRYLPDPTKGYLLLSSVRSLNRALSSLQSEEAADASVVRSLQAKVRAGTGRTPHSPSVGGGEQRRRFFRAKLRIRARVKRPDGDVVAAELGDLSAGGALVKIAGEPLEAGDTVALAIPMGEGKPVVVRARVVRAAPVRGLASLQFEQLRPGVEDRIVAFINRQRRDEKE